MNITRISSDQFALYAGISNAFTVQSLLRVEVVEGGLGGLRLVEERLATPYFKDYNAQGDDSPLAWARDFDIGRWGIFLAWDGAAAVGGVTVIPEAKLCPVGPFPRRDLAVVWDIRVHPDYRGRGVGAALFRHAAGWARAQGCGQIALETQNVNVAACRFYARMGCTLGAIHRFGYAGVPETAHEAVLVWYLTL